MTVVAADVEARARLSLGTSGDAIYRTVAAMLAEREAGGVLLDVGRGTGNLGRAVGARFARYLGADVVRYEDFPADGEFFRIDPDTGRVPVADGSRRRRRRGDHRTRREPAGLCQGTHQGLPSGRMGGADHTCQLSVLSKLTLLALNEFNAFRDGSYPAHLTALLEVDLRRIAAECGWTDLAIGYTGSGRMAGSARHVPRWLSARFPRAFSDNVAVMARTPTAVAHSRQ